MLNVHHLTKSFGVQPLFQNVSFSIRPGERLGLIGPNGSGKTTLLRILAGEEKPDSGSVELNPPGLRLGYLPQGMLLPDSGNLGSWLQQAGGDLAGLSRRLEELARQLAAGSGRNGLQEEYDATLARLQQISEQEGRMPPVLAALGLSNLDPGLPISALSGGQKTRLSLAGVLLANPQLLLLDEPTNHLDIDMLEWLEDWLGSYRGAALVVSHDRAFLDRSVNVILELDLLNRSFHRYDGNYSAFLEQKVEERERQQQAYSDQQEEIGRLRKAARQVRSLARPHPGGKAGGGDKFARGYFADRSLETIRRARTLEKRLEKLLDEDRLEKPKLTWEMKVEFEGVPEGGRDVVTLENLDAGYPGALILTNVTAQARRTERIALIGSNGSGKTTLLRTLAGLIPPLSGTVRLGSSIRAGYMAQEQESLDPRLSPLQTLLQIHSQSETAVRSFLSKFLFKGDDVFTPAGQLSFGERSRLMLACLAAQGCNLLLLDEPINHLDISARSRFEQALTAYPGTVIAAVHDRYFIEGFASTIWEIQSGRLSCTRLHLD